MLAVPPTQTPRVPLYSARTDRRDPESLYPEPVENRLYGKKIVFNYFSPSDVADNFNLSFVSCFVRPPCENTPEEGIFLEVKILHRWINQPNISLAHQTNIINVLNAINQVILEIQYSLNLNGFINRQVLESLNRLVEEEFELAQVQYHDVDLTLQVDRLTDTIVAYAQHQRHFIPVEDKNKINYFSIINKTSSIESLLRYFEAPSSEIAQKVKIFNTSDLHYYKLNYTNLRGKDLSKANLNWAYLFNENLSKIILNGAILNHSLLSGSNFEDAQCNGTSFVEVTAENTQFIKTSLIKADFTGADIRGSNFTGAKLQGAIFTNSILTGIHSNDESLIQCFIENDTLVGENRVEVFNEIMSFINRNPDFDVNDIKNQSILFGPLYSSKYTLLTQFVSFFTTIGKRSEEPTVLKRILSIENLIERKRFLNLFFSTIENKGLKISFKEIFKPTTEKFTQFSLHYIDYLLTYRYNFSIDQAEQHLTFLNDLNIIIFYVEKFIAQSNQIPPANEDMNQTLITSSNWLRNLNQKIFILANYLARLIKDVDYLFIEEDPPYVLQDNGHNRRIFISQDRQHLFYLSHSFFEGLMLQGEPENNMWVMNHDCLYFKYDPLYPETPYRQLIEEEKTSLDNIYSNVPFIHKYFLNRKRGNLENLLRAINLGTYELHFLNAVVNSSYNEKFTSVEHQAKLRSIFLLLFTFSGSANKIARNANTFAVSQTEFIPQLDAIFMYNKMTRLEKSELLIILCYIFTKLSGNWYFGTNDMTPVYLRYFARALLNSSVELSPNMFLESKVSEWKRNLVADYCSSSLASDMRQTFFETTSITKFKIYCPASLQ